MNIQAGRKSFFPGNTCRRLLGFALFGLVSSGQLASTEGLGNIVIIDDMSSPDYDSFSFNGFDLMSNLNDASSASWSSLDMGGNPAENLLIEHFHEVNDPQDNTDVVVQSFFLEQSDAYNPSVTGTILELSFSMDVKFENANGPVEFTDIFWIIGDSNGGNAAGIVSLSSNSSWQPIVSPIFTQADFGSRDFAGTLNLHFGFGFLSSGVVFDDPVVTSLQVDNFRVVITPVPEPASFFTVLSGTAACFLRRRRSQ